jgi:tyrosinase
MSELTFKVRQNVIALSAKQKLDYVKGVQALKTAKLSADPSIPADDASGIPNVYDWYVNLHQQAMMQPIHARPWFLPWHRQFILNLENAIRLIGANPNFALPYWDWATDAGTPSPKTRPVWGNDFMGGDGKTPFSTDPQGDKAGDVADGPFAAGKWAINVKPPGNAQSNLRRGFGNFDPVGAPTEPSQSDVNDALKKSTYDTAPYDASPTDSFRNALEQLHNRLHRWVGGCMVYATSPNDPVFFLHHCNLDRIWAQWQAQNPTATYLPEISPVNPPPGGGGWTPVATKIGGTDGMWPWSKPIVTPNGVWDYKGLGYVYDTIWPVFIPFAIPIAPIGVPRPAVYTGPVPWGAQLFSSDDCVLNGLPGPSLAIDSTTQSISVIGNTGAGMIRVSGSAIDAASTQYICLRGSGAVNQHPCINVPSLNHPLEWFQMWDGARFVDGMGTAGVVPIGPNGDCWFRRKPGQITGGFSFVMQDGWSGNNAMTMWAFRGEGLPDQ